MDKETQYYLLFMQLHRDIEMLHKTPESYRFEYGQRLSSEWFGRMMMAQLLERSDMAEQCRRAQQIVGATSATYLGKGYPV